MGAGNLAFLHVAIFAIMDCISSDELGAFFQSHNNRYKGASGLIYQLIKPRIYTSLESPLQEQALMYQISTTDCSLDTFISKFQITCLEQLDQLDYLQLWMRYLNSKAFVTAWTEDMDDCDALDFEIRHGTTRIYSASLHYYDEVSTHLTLPEDFAEYFERQEKMINHYMSNRFYR